MTNPKHSKKFYYFLMPLLTALLITGCGKGCGKGGVPGGEEAAALKLIPAGKNVLVGINWKELKKSPLGGKFQENIPEEFKSLGQEIEQITIGLDIQGMGQAPEKGLAVISGSFEPEKLIGIMKSQAQKDGQELEETDYQGIKLYTNPKEDMVAAFLDKKLLLGQKLAVQEAIDLSQNKGESVEKDQKLMDLLKTVDSSRMLWAVAIVPEGAMGAPGAQQPGSPLGALSGVKALDLALDISKELKVDLGIITGTPEDAKQMETMVNSYKTLFGASLAQQDPNLGKVFSNLNVKVNEKRVTLNLELDEATVTELSKKAEGAADSQPQVLEESETIVEEATEPEEAKSAEKK